MHGSLYIMHRIEEEEEEEGCFTMDACPQQRVSLFGSFIIFLLLTCSLVFTFRGDAIGQRGLPNAPRWIAQGLLGVH